MVNAILRRFELMSLNNSELPSGYKRLEFIQFSHNSYIDTKYIPNKKTQIKTNFMCIGIVYNGQYIFGGGEHFIEIYVSGTDVCMVYRVNTSGLAAFKAYSKELYEIEFNKRNWRCKCGDKYDTTATDSRTMNVDRTNSSIYLNKLNRSQTWTPNIGVYRLYKFSIYESETDEWGEVIRDYIPARRKSDNAVGLYETVEGKFYTSANSDVIYGSDETIPSTLEYVEEYDEEETTNDELIDGYTVLPDGTTYHKTTE